MDFLLLSGIIVGGVGILIALAVVPTLVPWPGRLRWIIATTQCPDPWGLVWPPAVDMQEVSVWGLTPGRDVVAVGAAGGLAPPRRLAFGAPPTTAQLLCLEGWAAARIPLLMVTEPGGTVVLHGPTRSVEGLVSEPDRAAAAARADGRTQGAAPNGRYERC